MEFSKFDVSIIVSMTLAIVIMSMAFPAVGLSEDDAASESDVPEFDIDASRFDFTGEFPQNPGTPATGTIQWRASVGTEGEYERYLQEGGDEAWLTAETTPDGSGGSAPTATLTIYNATSDNFVTENYQTKTETSTTLENEKLGWKVRVTFANMQNVSGGWDFDLEYEVIDRPSGESGGGFISSIPVIGALFDAGESLASVIAWLGSIMWWFTTVLFEISINLLSLMFDVMLFVTDTLSWLVGTYQEAVSAADGWAGVVLVAPGMLLFAEFAKLVMVAISLLPTT